MGTPDFSVPALHNLADGPHDVVCVYTQPPRPKGRGHQVQPSPVHLAAGEHGIEVRTPHNFKGEKDLMDFMGLDLDVAVVAAYGLILPQAVLDAPQYGCLNIHASLLPRWRGAAPIQRAILEGDSETGITIMQMEAGLDTGPMIARRAVPIRSESTAQSIHDELSALGSAMIEDVLDDLAAHKSLSYEIQDDDQATYASKITKQHGRIDWTSGADRIDRQIRALNPWPGTWCDGFKILEASLTEQKTDQPPGILIDKSGHVSCGHGTILQLHKIQPQNKKPMDITAAINGNYLSTSQILK